MDTLENSHACRLCSRKSDNKLNIFDYANKIEIVLPIKVYEQDCFPKVICDTCIRKLDTCYDFFLEVLETDKRLKMELSWMKNAKEVKIKDGDRPMIKIHNVNIKTFMYNLDPVINNTDYKNSVKSRTSYANNKLRTGEKNLDMMAHQVHSQYSCKKQNHRRRLLSNVHNQDVSIIESNKEINLDSNDDLFRTIIDKYSNALSQKLPIKAKTTDIENTNNVFQQNNEEKMEIPNPIESSIVLRKRHLREVSRDTLNHTLRTSARCSVNVPKTRQKSLNILQVNNVEKSNNDDPRTETLDETKKNIISQKIKKKEDIHIVRRALRPRIVTKNYSENNVKIFYDANFLHNVFKNQKLKSSADDKWRILLMRKEKKKAR